MKEITTGGVLPMMTHLMDDARETIQMRDKRIAELEAILRETHDPLVISEALLRKHGYGETAEMVKVALDKVGATVCQADAKARTAAEERAMSGEWSPLSHLGALTDRPGPTSGKAVPGKSRRLKRK